MDNKLSAYKSEVPLLVEAGFVAVKMVDEDSAKKCFYASMVLDPEISLPVVGLGIIHMFKLELDEAIRLFGIVLQKEPENEMAKAMLGIAHLYMLNDEHLKEGGAVIESVLSETKDPTIEQLAKDALELKKEIKKKMKDLHPLETGVKVDPKKHLKK